MKQPKWWNHLHDAALAALTPEWQRVAGMADAVPSISAYANRVVIFDDLVTAGVAEVQRRPVFVFGIQRGEQTYFRLAA